jgi:predicted O-methyltransferase YrrM
MRRRSLRHRIGVRLARTSVGRDFIAGALWDDDVLREVVNRLSNRIAAESTFDDVGDTIESFEDCVGLLSSNQLNHGVSRMMIVEAAYLYRLVRSLREPAVVELGRYRGGTTFLFAAAGASVLSIDNDTKVAEHDRLLVSALERRGLAERVTLVIADSQTYAPVPSAQSVVLVDGDHTYEGVRLDIARWLPALAPGGHLLVHDAFTPEPPRPWTEAWNVEGVQRACDELREDSRVTVAGRAGTLADFVVAA